MSVSETSDVIIYFLSDGDKKSLLMNKEASVSTLLCKTLII